MRLAPNMRAGQNITPTIRLLRPLDQGGMGLIWVAEHLALNTHVAVKFMAPGYTEDPKFARRFQQEAQSAARLRSPHVTQVFDHGTTPDGEPYIVMELLSGETLRQRMLRSAPLPLDEVVRLVEQTATALDAAHRLGIVHRDIKPENLFILDVGGKPFVKVLDFGIAKQLQTDPRLTTTGKALGSPLYMSPERFDDATGKTVDHRADLWALGVIAYEAITGKPPFMAATLWALAMVVQQGVFQPPSALRSELPKALDDWMTKALAHDADARFNAAMEMADALAAASRPISVVPPSTPESMAFPATERISINPPSSDDAMVEVVQDRETGSWSMSLPGKSPRAIAFDERGESLFVASWTGQVLCMDLATKQPRWSRRLRTRALCVAAGPGWAAVGCGDGDVRLLDAARGTVETTLEGHERALRAVAMNLGGALLAACGEDNLVSLWHVATGERLHTTSKEHSAWVRSVAFGARNGVVASGGREATVRLWDTALRPTKTLRHGLGSVRALAFAPDESYLAAGYGDGKVRLWETRRWELARTLAGDKTHVLSVAFDRRSEVVVAGMYGGNVRIWNASTGEQQRVLVGTGAPVLCVATSPDGRHIASVCADGWVHVHAWPLHPRLGEVPGGESDPRG
jgi:serine/threonine protein kinase